MKINVLLLFFALCIISACEKSQDDDDIDNKKKTVPGLQPQEIIDSLNDAYTANSKVKLKRILDYWHLENQSINNSEIENGTVRNIYEVFQEFYTPLDIGRLGWHEWGSDIYKDVKYIIVQNKIYYDFGFDSDMDNLTDTIFDFRPDIAFDNVDILYLTLNYEIALNAFLGSEFYPLGTYGIMNPALPAEESYKRQQFLNQYLMIFHGHWGGYWHIETHPELYTLHFDKNMQKVNLSFRVGYMFGDAYLEKKNGKWELVSSAITAIE